MVRPLPPRFAGGFPVDASIKSRSGALPQVISDWGQAIPSWYPLDSVLLGRILICWSGMTGALWTYMTLTPGHR